MCRCRECSEDVLCQRPAVLKLCEYNSKSKVFCIWKSCVLNKAPRRVVTSRSHKFCFCWIKALKRQVKRHTTFCLLIIAKRCWLSDSLVFCKVFFCFLSALVFYDLCCFDISFDYIIIITVGVVLFVEGGSY